MTGSRCLLLLVAAVSMFAAPLLPQPIKIDASKGANDCRVAEPRSWHDLPGDQEYPSGVALQTGGSCREFAAQADESGAYQAVLFHPT